MILLLAGAGYFWFHFYYVFGEGVKAGTLNQLVYKGYIWKTYEGRLILSGFSGAKGGGSIQSNEFNFSVKKGSIAADSLMRCSGKMVELHYKEYLGHLPWRGRHNYIVDSILFVGPLDNTTVIPITGDQ